MKKQLALRTATLTAALIAGLMAGCGNDKPETLIASGKEFLAKNDSKAAVIQFKNALQQNPDLGEARFFLGKALLEGGDARGAEVELRKAYDLKYAPEMTIPLLAKAMLAEGQAKKVVDEFAGTELSGEAAASLKTSLNQAYRALGNREAAQAALAAALKAKPDFAPALLAEARVKAAQDDVAGAIAIIDGVLASNAGDPDALMLKGSLLAFKGDQAPAMEFYRKAVQSKPDHLAAHSAIFSALMQKGELDDAAKQLDEMKKLAPKSLQTLYLETQLAYQRKDYKKTRDISQQLLKVAPDSPLFLQIAGAAEYQLGAYVQAETFLNKALQQAPELSMARRMLVANYLRSGQPAKAINALQSVLDKIDKDPAFLALAGDAYLQSGDPKKAEEYFAKASKLEPDNPARRTSLALASMAQGNVSAATLELEQISRDDKGTIADRALIASYLKRNELDKAMVAIEALQKKTPDDPSTYAMLGRVHLAKKDAAAARQSFEKALALNPAYIPAVGHLATMDIAEKKPADARKRFESVLVTDPKNVTALLALAKLTVPTGGKPEEALALINKAVSSNPTELAPRLALIEFQLASKEPKKAATAAQEALAAIPDKPELLDAAGRAQMQAGDTNQALATYAKLAALQPTSPLADLRTAEIQFASKNNEEAAKSLRKALTIKPGLLEAQRNLILVYLAAGKPNDALVIARDVAKQRPRETVGYAFEGDIQASQKRWPEAVAAYRSGMKQAPSTELAIRLHKTLLASQNANEADKTASDWIKAHPKDVAFRLYLGDVATARKDYPAAIQHYRTVVDQQPENALALNNLAWAAGQLKSPKAIEYAEKANKLAPNQPALMDTLAMLMADKGDTAGAITLLRKALEISPQAAALRLNLARVLISAGKKEEARSELDTLAKMGDKFPEQDEVMRLQKSL
jgi:putative PEP-CTERM system TPR-repeat lipoprotein